MPGQPYQPLSPGFYREGAEALRLRRGDLLRLPPKGKDGLYTKTKILSTGNSKIRYTGKFQIIKGKKLIDEYPIDSKVVASNGHYIATQKIKADKIKEAGDYTIRMVLNYIDENDNKKSIKEDAILRITGEI